MDTWTQQRWRTSLLVTPQISWEMHLGLAGLLHSLGQFESSVPIWIPHHSLAINKQGLHDLLDHRRVSYMHKCSVVKALITGADLVFAGYRTCQSLTAKPRQCTDFAEKGRRIRQEQDQSHLQRLGRCVGSSPGTTRTESLTATWRIHSSKWLLGGICIGIQTWQKFGIFECERFREAVLQKASSQAAWMLCNGYRKFLTAQSRFVYIWNIRSWNKIQKMIAALMKCSWHPLILNFIFVLCLLLHQDSIGLSRSRTLSFSQF